MSKQVLDRQKSAAAVGDALREHGAPIARNLTQKLAPFATTEVPTPDVGALLVLVGRLLSHRAASLVVASNAHDREIADDAAPRARRDAAEQPVRQRIIELRSAVEGTYGELGLRALGLWEPPASGPDAVRAYARATCEALVDPALVLTPLHAPGVFEFRPSGFASVLAPLVDTLDAAVAEVSRERREAETTLVAKQDAIAAHDLDFVRFVNVVEQLARAAGLDELADRVRPSTREPGVLAEPAEDVGAGTPPASSTGANGGGSPRPAVEPGMPGAEPLDTTP